MSGDQVPRACPNGTYNANEYASDISNCTLCPVDHYNHLLAQTACFHCGGQATQPFQGQDKCKCNGLHRVFLVRESLLSIQMNDCLQGVKWIKSSSHMFVPRIYESFN